MAKCGSCGQEIPELEIETFLPFSAFKEAWIGLKVDWLRGQRAWNRLNNKDRMAALADLERRRGLVDPKYFPRPPAYLNGKRWNDELPAQTIPDPPKPAQPDGGMARKTTWRRWEDVIKTNAVAPEVARAKFAEILKSVKVKSL